MRAGVWRTMLGGLVSLALAAGTTTAAPVTTLAVANDSSSICNAPMLIGVAKGLFYKHGLDIRMHAAGNGFVSLQETNLGAVEIGTAAPTVVVQTISQGARLKSIFVGCGDATGTRPTDGIAEVVARRTSGVREGHLEDLRGKRVGVGARGTVNHQYLFSALAAKGLDPTSAVTLVIAPPGGLARALQSGAVDAVVTGVAAASEVLHSTGDAFVVQRGGNYMRYVILRVVRSQYLATHPGTIKRYIAAFAEAAQYVRMNPEEATDILMRDRPGIARETVRAEVRDLDPDIRVSKATVRAVQRSGEFAVTIGAIKQAPAFEEIFDLRSLRQVEREHPELFRDLPPVPEALKL